MHDDLPLDPDELATTGVLKLAANVTLRQARDLGAGTAYTPTLRADDDWKIAIETSRGGVVGVWSSWLGNKILLGYPGVPSLEAWVGNVVQRCLGVEIGTPVTQVDATLVSPDYEGEDHRDPDKPLEAEEGGRALAYKTRAPRCWATYRGPRVHDGAPGRVWVEHGSRCSTSQEFRIVEPGSLAGLSTISYGWGNGGGRAVCTFPYAFANKYAPDGPVVDPEYVRPYRDKFLALACELAGAHGGARAVHVDYGFALTPAQLGPLGYGDVAWLAGSPDVYHGWGREVVLAKRALGNQQIEHVLLVSGNELVPWATIRRVPQAHPVTVEALLGLLVF